MTHMIFRHGDMKKWKGVGYDFEIVKAEELQEYLDAGWFAHPDDLLKDVAEPESEPDPAIAGCRLRRRCISSRQAQGPRSRKGISGSFYSVLSAFTRQFTQFANITTSCCQRFVHRASTCWRRPQHRIWCQCTVGRSPAGLISTPAGPRHGGVQ